MSKYKKEVNPRPNKYSEKLVLNTTFDGAIKVLAAHANSLVAGGIKKDAVKKTTKGK